MLSQIFILGVLCFVIIISELLVRNTFLKYFSTALLVILITALVANLGIIPASSTRENPVAVYDGIFQIVAPLSIVWLLLQVNLRSILKAGLPLITLFLIGSLATTLGVIIEIKVVNGSETIGPLFHAIAGMFTGTYTGGSVNFNAVALHYNVMSDPTLFAGTVVVDNIVTTHWMVVCIGLPTYYNQKTAQSPKSPAPDLGIEEDTESVHPLDFGWVLLIGFVVFWISEQLSIWMNSLDLQIPSILILTTLALILAQLEWVSKLKGTRLLGIFSIYLFLGVIGAFCDLQALASIGPLGATLLIFALITVAFHGVVMLLVARLFNFNITLVAVASQANIGGGTSALAVARSLGYPDLVLPAILLGSLGNAIGTFLGFWVAAFLN